MCIINEVKSFVFSGMRTFRTAAKGKYDGESEAVGEIRREMFSQPTGRYGDVLNMHRDRQMVGRDARIGFNKIKAANG